MRYAFMQANRMTFSINQRRIFPDEFDFWPLRKILRVSSLHSTVDWRGNSFTIFVIYFHLAEKRINFIFNSF